MSDEIIEDILHPDKKIGELKEVISEDDAQTPPKINQFTEAAKVLQDWENETWGEEE